MTDLHGVSMFSGIGLLDLAMHRAGITPALLCEKDNAARQVLARHYPDVPIHDDVSLWPSPSSSGSPDASSP